VNLGTFKIYKAHILCGRYLLSLHRPLHMVISSAVITITCNWHDSGSTHCRAMYCSCIRFLPHSEKFLEMVAFSLQTYITPNKHIRCTSLVCWWIHRRYILNAFRLRSMWGSFVHILSFCLHHK